MFPGATSSGWEQSLRSSLDDDDDADDGNDDDGDDYGDGDGDIDQYYDVDMPRGISLLDSFSSLLSYS